MIKMLKSVLNEYGLDWTINRGLYSAKLKIMTKIPVVEQLFEKRISIKRINIFDFDLEPIKEFLLKLSKKEQKIIIEVADKAINGVITGFSSIDLDYGKPINWHLNPLTGFENNKELKWYKIPDFDNEVGDIKVIWEASRLTHFLYFARAYLITRDDKYYKAFSGQLENWLKNNPYSYGSNYKCGQEATLRMTNVLISYSVFNYFGLITEKDKQHVFEIVEGSYKKVLSNFFYAHKCIKNNHTFTEFLGLIIGAWCSEDNVKLQNAYKLMDKEIINQFLPDGGFTQYSFNYHRFTLQIFECLFKISEKTGIYITETERIKNSILLLYNVQAENGDVPNYGSNDGALIFPLSICDYRDFRPVLNTMYVLMTGKRLYEKGPYDEELLWFGGSTDLPVERRTLKSIAFEYSGFYVLRSEDSFLMTCLQDYKSRPAHMDQLHIDIWHKGINVLCDSGTHSYASELGKELSSTIGHNVVKLPGIEQMNKRGAFLVTDWTKQDSAFHSDSEFKGKMESKNGYSHERIIRTFKKSYLIEDWVKGESKTCDFIFHTPCEVKIKENGFVLFMDNNEIVSVKTEGDISIIESYRSLYYLRKEKINRVQVTQEVNNGICNAKFEITLH
ncbi:MAG: hypothetical protein GT589_00235 [Peptoclostridium sp.]|uniref:heparinase II/III family protein n=1 Tax=Peptoclostridium sp. TaxID=1904860 RepID=UPI00139D2B07|nr:heparinase II/III family protein [Peptoclostridium sp.]MZQ74571.1 hypothetical protein [Peptoclostridium sp.]